MGMTKYDRLLHILNLLRSRKNLNAASLAEECGVTERSIYRDILALSEANIPIYYDSGYKLASGNFLPPLNFDIEEYHSLKMALESSPLNQADHHGKILARILAKVEAGLTETVRKQERFRLRTTHVEVTSRPDEEQGLAFYSVLEKAIEKNVCIEIEYESVSSGWSTRIVEPYFIVFRGRAFYFVAFCRLRKEFRTFKIVRVRALKLTGEEFVPQSDVDPRSYFEDSWQVFSGDPVEVILEFRGSAAKVIAQGIHHPKEQIEDIGQGKVIYKVKTRGLEEIQRWLLGYGDEVTVIAPTELRQNVSRIGKCLFSSNK